MNRQKAEAPDAATGTSPGDAKPPFYKVHKSTRRVLKNQNVAAIGVNEDEVIGSLVTIVRKHTGSSDPEMAFYALAAALQLCVVFGLDKTRRTSGQVKRMRDEFRDLNGLHDLMEEL
jgi:hypothetical protein